MPPAVNWLVPKVQLKDNNVVLTIEVGGFSYGNWAEISGYIIQDDVIENDAIQKTGAFIPFSAIQAVPAPVNGVSSVTVNVAAAGLEQGKDVKVITRVAEVQIWPTVLTDIQELAVQGVTARWQARDGNPGYNPQVRQQSSQTSAGTTDPAVIVELSSQSISLKDLQPGVRYRITIEAADS
jgi:hypothetical protein